MRKIYLQKDSLVSPLKEEVFEKELVLQELLEKHPHLLPAEEIIGNPTFVIVQRELPISVGFIDLLLIDQMMVPTVVETKVNNPEIRRKIIGQGYEYLTSLAYELTGKQIINYTKSYWKDDYQQEIKDKLGVDSLSEKEIDKNLKKPRLRLIFAADFIPRELRKFVEFINNASRGIDVYAVQIERFLLDDKRIISVSTWGPTESVVHDKSASFGLLSREEFINKINKSETLSPIEKDLYINRVNEILNTAEQQGLSIGWGTKSFRITYPKGDEFIKLLEFYYNGDAWVSFLPVEKRDEFVSNTYQKLNDALDLQKKYIDPKAQYKMGMKKLYQLSETQYLLLKEVLNFFKALN